MPFSFWAVIGLLAWGGAVSFSRMKDGTGLPMLAVLGTVAAWYVGDAFYNDYAHYHVKTFTADVLADAWWEVAWFLVVFMISVPMIHEWMNARDLRRNSGALQIFKCGVNQSNFQKQLTLLFNGCVILWVIIGAFAAVRLQARFGSDKRLGRRKR